MRARRPSADGLIQRRPFNRQPSSTKHQSTDNWPSIADLSHLVAVTLVKIRVRWGVRVLCTCKVVTFQDHVTTNLVWNSRTFRPGHEMEELVPLTRKIEDHIAMLFCWTEGVNRHFWPALLNPGGHLTAAPNHDRMGDEGEMQKVLQECYNAWIETKSAVFLMRELLEMGDNADRRISALSPEEFEAKRARALEEVD